ncbi:unnamed protein product [Mytilus coruscus]|uniref:Uncharacterized protein n=1 Tax=Mytilus coruscus TaxID=42192 RepID=A0A6J8EN16_MYTCO|nr:unnamed protein product [Mytilus coruscus]
MNLKLRSIRTGHRSAVSRLIKKFEDVQQEENGTVYTEDLSNILDSLKRKQDILRKLDEDIIQELDDGDIETEIVEADEYAFNLEEEYDKEKFWKTESFGIEHIDEKTTRKKVFQVLDLYQKTSYHDNRHFATLSRKEDHTPSPVNKEIAKWRKENVMIMMFAPSWIDCYDFKCPEKPHRKIRANWLCNLMEENYSCMLDLQQTTFKESCSFASDFVRPGQKYVISGRRKNMNCSNERYQPFRLYSSELSTCVFEKSSCSAEGQIIFSEGSTKEDRTCRCDYSRGYTFLSRPKDLCYCTPNEADCSCYIAACPESRSLSTDYECKADFQSLGICKPIEKNGKRHPYDTTAGEREFVKSSIRRKERNNISIKVMLLITVMLVSFCCILIIVVPVTLPTTETGLSNTFFGV